MSYTRQNFVEGQVLKAEHLNHMELGIEEAVNTATSTVLNKSQINAIDSLFRLASYTGDARSAYAQFCEAFGIENPDEPHWVIGLSHGNGATIGPYMVPRAMYVSENGDYELQFASTDHPDYGKKYYPMRLGENSHVVVTCPSNMTPAVAVMSRSEGKWTEKGVSGWMQAGGGTYAVPSGATHFYCVIRKTDDSALTEADFENVVVSLTEPDEPERSYAVLLYRLLDKLTDNTAAVSANDNLTRMMVYASVPNSKRLAYHNGSYWDTGNYSPIPIPTGAVSAVFSIPEGMRYGMAFLGEKEDSNQVTYLGDTGWVNSNSSVDVTAYNDGKHYWSANFSYIDNRNIPDDFDTDSIEIYFVDTNGNRML